MKNLKQLEEDLMEVLAQYGNVEDCRVLEDIAFIKVTKGFENKGYKAFEIGVKIMEVLQDYPVVGFGKMEKDLFHYELRKRK